MNENTAFVSLPLGLEEAISSLYDAFSDLETRISSSLTDSDPKPPAKDPVPTPQSSRSNLRAFLDDQEDRIRTLERRIRSTYRRFDM